ncbi:MAG: hypothetical protein U0599_08225 [Vicinamibacteria bacterium]
MLGRAYVEYFEAANDYFRPFDLLERSGWARTELEQALEALRDLLQVVDSAPSYRLTPHAIQLIESLQISPADLTARNHRVRNALLRHYGALAESQGPLATEHISVALRAAERATNAPAPVLESNHEALFRSGYLAHPSSLGYFALSRGGMAAFRI